MFCSLRQRNNWFWAQLPQNTSGGSIMRIELTRSQTQSPCEGGLFQPGAKEKGPPLLEEGPMAYAALGAGDRGWLDTQSNRLVQALSLTPQPSSAHLTTPDHASTTNSTLTLDLRTAQYFGGFGPFCTAPPPHTGRPRTSSRLQGPAIGPWLYRSVVTAVMLGGGRPHQRGASPNKLN